MTADYRVPGQVFGEVAEDFDRVRLGYPDDLVEDVLSFSRLADSGRRVLEVGAGTGKATLAFAARGVPIVALEPDEAMAAVLAHHVAGVRNVRVVRCRFEDYGPDEAFGLLYAADAWHWTEPILRWRLAAEALVRGGTLALFWNRDRIEDTSLRNAMVEVLTEIAPVVVVNDAQPEPNRLLNEGPGSELTQRSEFGDVVSRIFTSRLIIPGVDYLTYMSTRSQIRMQTEPTRKRLFAALTDVFSRDVPVVVHSVLYLARRTSATG